MSKRFVRSSANNLRDLFIDTAEKLKIYYQFDILERGGTDSGAIHLHRRGVPNLVMAVPTRHIHSYAGIINRDDFDQAVKLVTAVIKKLDADTVGEPDRIKKWIE